MSFHVLCQLTDLLELFAALLTGVRFVLAVDQGLAVLPRLVPHEPALGGEGLITSLRARQVRAGPNMLTSYHNITTKLSQSVSPRRQGQRLQTVLRGQSRWGHSSLPLRPRLEDHLYVVDRLHVTLEVHPSRELITTLGTVPVLLLSLHNVLIAGVPVDHLD